MVSKEDARKKIKELIDLYDQYKKSPKIIGNEQQICDSLIRPFFRDVLGWNIEDPYEFKSQYNMSGKRMDYLVCVEDVSQFIVEAKAPTVDIKSNTHFYTQAIQYAEAKGKDFAILTNFETFIILRAGIETKGILANEITRIDLFNLSDVGLDFLLYFSKEFWIEQGENNPLYSVRNLKKKRSLDEILVEQMSKWRERLRGSLTALSSGKYNFEDQKDREYVEEEIQRFVDRLIFICYCEDKQLNDNELKPLLREFRTKHIGKKTFIINEIKKIFDKYYGIYNSDLFKRGICDEFEFDDSILSEILEDLRGYYEGLPYDFSVIDADILGRAYENFLGHTTTGKVRFKEKKDKGKRKKMGIYYTPQYIVNYIVKNTVREKIKDMNFEEILNVKIVDPACGSGSFLIKAFDVLVEESKIRLKKELTYEQKEKLLLNCIHGVDLDDRACDVAKLNLSLKLAERGKKLPQLYHNIQNGNSLIDDPKIAGEKAFNWDEKFPFKFDVIIGNPPYVDIKQLDPQLVKYLFGKYNTVENRMNLYSTFVEKSFYLLKKDGLFGFIIPNSILYNESYNKLRKLLFENSSLKNIVKLPDDTFGDAKVETIILVYKKRINKNNICEVLIYQRNVKTSQINIESAQISHVPQLNWEKQGIINISTNDNSNSILQKIEEKSKPLINICDFSLGLTPYDKYKGHTKKQIDERVFHSTNKKDNTFKPLLSGSNIVRYGVFWDKKEYIRYGDWLGAPRQKKFFTEPRIIVRQILSGKPIRIYAGYTEEEFYNAQIGFNLVAKDKDIPLKFILAILNSNLINFYHREKFLDKEKNLFQKILIANAKNFPIRLPSPIQEKKIIDLVNQMLSLQKEYHYEKILRKDKIKDEIEKIDKEINDEVYKLYEITEEEKKIVEESLK